MYKWYRDQVYIIWVSLLDSLAASLSSFSIRDIAFLAKMTRTSALLLSLLASQASAHTFIWVYNLLDHPICLQELIESGCLRQRC